MNETPNNDLPPVSKEELERWQDPNRRDPQTEPLSPRDWVRLHRSHRPAYSLT